MLSLQNGVQGARPVTDIDDGACFESDNDRERLERMSKTLLNGEGEHIDGDGLYGSVLGQCSFQDVVEIALNDCRTHTRPSISRDEIKHDGIYPESAKPSVLPISSSMFTSPALGLTAEDSRNIMRPRRKAR
jgi:hypothetical protein